MDEGLFGIVDLVMFIGLLLISTSIGIYSAFKGRKNETTENYYFGNRRMSPIPLACSMAVSFLSAISMMATPTEVYLFGAVISWAFLGDVLAITFTCMYFVPLFLRLHQSSIYEYFELRFDRKVRLFCSAVSIIQMVFYMGFCIYMPALALNAVTPLDIKWTILLTSIVCTFYTTLGGFKAVVWTDVVQAMIMLIGSAALFIRGAILVGGPSEVWDAVQRGGRLNIFKFTLDPTIRSSLLPALVGSTFLQTSSMCSNQAMAQRIISCDSVKNARKTLIYYLFPWAMIFLLAIANGCLLYAYYEGCDPHFSGKIKKFDQFIPNMMISAFRDIPGLAGVFVAAACSGTLSTVSSGINSLSVLVLHDFILQVKGSMTAKQQLWTGKICGLIIGFLVTVIAYLTGYLGTTTLQVSASSLGTFGGPIFGLFLAGMFIPRINAKGALCGVILSLCLTLWIAAGAAVYGLSDEKKDMLPLSTSECSTSSPNITSPPVATTVLFSTDGARAEEPYRPAIADTLYSISFYYFGMIGAIATIVFSGIVSLLTGTNDPQKMDPHLFVPIVDSARFSPDIRKSFRFGVPEMDQKMDVDNLDIKEPILSNNEETSFSSLSKP